MQAEIVPGIEYRRNAGEASSDLMLQLHRLTARLPCENDPSTEDMFPSELLADLRRIGVLKAPLPAALGGLGWGTTAARTADIRDALRLVGRLSLPLGRVVEAHVNAIRLVHLYAPRALLARVAADVRAGHLLGLWVTSFTDPVRMHENGETLQLRGVKDVCSGAGHAGRAVISAIDPNGDERLVYVETQSAEVLTDRKLRMHGMRGTSTTAVRFETTIASDDLVGAAGDYMREPDFSAGAWRTSAVTVGGLEALVHEAIQQLKRRGRADDPHQQARLGEMVMARETALLWLKDCAARAEASDPYRHETVAFVNLARLAIEACCLRVIPLVQRSLGLAGLQQSNPAERLMRDLATYLRQPAGDEVLAVAAAWFISHDDAETAA